MLNDKQVRQAALEFAKLQPVQWDAWLIQWEKEHSEPAGTEIGKTSVTSSDTSSDRTYTEQEMTDTKVPEVKKRKAVVKKVKAADS